MLYMHKITPTKGESYPGQFGVTESQLAGLRNRKKKQSQGISAFYAKILFNARLVAQPFQWQILMCVACSIPLMEKRKTVFLCGAQ